MPEVSEGSVVDGRYRVLQRIGSGGMADVWLADDTHLQRRVALKVLHRRFAQDREFVERFRREAEAAASLQHPNIVAVFDRGEFEGTYYIAMQYVEGPTLKQLIDAGLSSRAGGSADSPGAGGGPFRPSQRGRPPRPEAAERDRRPRWQGRRHRLRHRPRRSLGDHPDGLGDGDAALPLARAGSGPRRDRGLRPLLDRGDSLRGADRPRALRGGERRGGGDETGLAGAAAAQLDQPPGLAGARRGRDAGAGEGPRAALPERRRLHRGARRGDQGARRARWRHRRLRRAATGRRDPRGRRRRSAIPRRRSAASVAGAAGCWSRSPSSSACWSASPPPATAPPMFRT